MLLPSPPCLSFLWLLLRRPFFITSKSFRHSSLSVCVESDAESCIHAQHFSSQAKGRAE